MGAYLSTDGPDKQTREKLKQISQSVADECAKRNEKRTSYRQFVDLSIQKAKVILSFAERTEANDWFYYVDMRNIQKVEELLQEKTHELICDAYRGNFNFEIKQKALKFARRRFDSLSQQENVCVYSPCPYTSDQCKFKHPPALDEYTNNYITSLVEVKKMNISLWVYFAQRFKQDLI